MSPAPPVLSSSRPDLAPIPQRWVGPTMGIFLALVLVVLWRYEPAGQFFYPRCAFHELTGWKCPGCGGTRAAHALLHGNLTEAWQQNPLAVLLTPGAAWLFAREIRGRSTGRWWRWPHLPKWVWVAAGGIIAAFGVLRNWV